MPKRTLVQRHSEFKHWKKKILDVSVKLKFKGMPQLNILFEWYKEWQLELFYNSQSS